MKEKLKKVKTKLTEVKNTVVETVKENPVPIVFGLLSGLGVAGGIFAIKKGERMIESEVKDWCEENVTTETITTSDGKEISGQWLDLGAEGKMFFTEEN